ncbi:MAG TPA: hypothetical protein VF176_02915 [Solirubrobacterales bacterium]
MNRPHSLRTLLVTALGALALLALPAAAGAKVKDRNHDRIPDRWERRHHLSLNVKQTHRDQDRDHLRNRAEFLADNDPHDADSDDDGVADGEENAGTIQSFDAETGRLVIDLFGGDSVSGLVTDQTEISEIECEGGDSATASHDGEDGTGSDSSEGDEDEDGSDSSESESHEGHGEEAGDDHSGPDLSSGACDEGGGCTTADLVAGAVVEEAELRLANGSAVFEEIELGD